MVDQAANGRVHIARHHRAHQVKAHVNHLHARRIDAAVLHDAAHKRLGQLRTRVANGLTHQIGRLRDVLLLKRKDNVQRPLHNCADRLDRHVLLDARLDDVLLVIQADVRLPCRDHAHRIIDACRRLDVNGQALFRKVPGLLRLIQESMQCVRVPIQHDGQFAQFSVSLCGVVIVCIGILPGSAAGKQQCARRKCSENSLFHL